MVDEPKHQPLDYRSPNPKRMKVAEDPVARRWRYRRILFRAGLFLLLSPVALFYGPNVIMFRKLTRLAPADLVPTVQQFGVPAVRAIKEYQRDTGQFPNQIQDLQPKYLALEPAFAGHIENGQFVMWDWTDYNEMITYDFTPSTEGWTVQGPFANGPIPLPSVTIGPATQSIHPPK